MTKDRRNFNMKVDDEFDHQMKMLALAEKDWPHKCDIIRRLVERAYKKLERKPNPYLIRRRKLKPGGTDVSQG